MTDYVKQHGGSISFPANGQSWVILSDIEKRIKEKIEKIGTPLKDWDISIYRGILTGCNAAFIINKDKREELIKKSPNSAEIIRPILRGKDIKRYGYKFADLYLINTHNGISAKNIPAVDIKKYPVIKAHLDKYWTKIKNRDDQGITPYNLRSCAYTDDFSKQKIIYPGIMRIAKNNQKNFPRFALDTEKHFFFGNDCYFIVGKNIEYLWLFLNSTLCGYLFRYYIYSFDETGFKIFTEYFQNIPLPKPHKTLIEEAKIIIKNKVDILEVDKWVYNLYKFTPDEIFEIENAVNSLIMGT